MYFGPLEMWKISVPAKVGALMKTPVLWDSPVTEVGDYAYSQKLTLTPFQSNFYSFVFLQSAFPQILS